MKRKHLKLILIAITAIMAVSAICVHAQNGYVVFMVRDKKTSEPIIGAVVRIKGTDKATMTNLDGFAALNGVKYDNVYEVSCIGYKTKSDKIENTTNFQIDLEEDVLD